MEASSQTTCSQLWSYVAGRHPLLTSTHVASDEEPRNLLEAGSTFDANKFYAKAFILQWKTQQMSPDSVSDTDSSRSPVMLDADDEIKQLLYCFFLLISPDRSNHCRGNSRSAGGQVTACALREQSLAKGAKKYTLYAAMNKGFGTQDERHVREVARWVQSRESEISEIYRLVFDHLSSRIESYLDCISSDFDDVTVLATYPWTEKLVELHRALSKAYDSGKGRRDEWRVRLDDAVEFVTEHRKDFNDMRSCLPDSSNSTILEHMWNEIERLSRIPIAIHCLIAFRNKIVNTCSKFEITRVKLSQSRHHFTGAESKSSRALALRYVDLIPESGRKQLCVTREDFEHVETTQNLSERSKTVHCEIQLLEHLLVTEKIRGLHNVYNYIGGSKEPCWLCDFVIRTGTNFKMTKSHAGIYWNWNMPKSLGRIVPIYSALRKVDRAMLDTIEEARNSARWKKIRKRRESLTKNDLLTGIELNNSSFTTS